MGFSFSLILVSFFYRRWGILSKTFIQVNSTYRLKKTINLSGKSLVSISKTDKPIYCFIHATNIFWALPYKRETLPFAF